MKDALLFILITTGLMTCHNAKNNQEGDYSSESFSSSGAGSNKNDTSSATSGFMRDSRFGRGGSATSSWTFSSTTGRSRIVETKYGRVQGLSVTLNSNIHYTGRNFPMKSKIVEIFFSIPYAAPPIKLHRFSPTQTPIPWNDVRPAIHPSAVCPQIFPDIRNESAALKEMPKGYLEYLRRIEPYLRNQSEDCLYLNIFSPIGPEPKLKPVVVYIHGGMFAWGSGNLSDGTILAAYSDVIFVSLNYRLNILGFLNLNDSPNTKPRVANFGLMDQIAALHWIKENIRNFAGDPDNITLLGYEAGAACINFLMSSPTVTPGLFHRSILIAGSSQAPWALISDPSVAALAMAHALNCSSSSGMGGNSSTSLNNLGSSSSGGVGPGAFGQETTSTSTTTAQPPSRESHHLGISSPTTLDPILDCLRSRHFSDFTKFTLPKFSLDFGPSVDGIVIKPNFRTSLPSPMGKRDINKKYDLLFGISSLEKLTEFSEIDLEFGFEALRRDAILRTLVRNSYRYHRNEILATITNEYIDWEKSVQHPVSTRDLTVNAVTDCLSLAPVVAAADSSQIKKSYFYVFEHSTKDGLYNYQRAGAGGGEELNYMFGYPLVEAATGQVLPFIPAPLPSNYSKSEIALSELWMTFVSNFAHSGNPNGPIKIDSISSWPISKERNRYKNTAWEGYDRLHQKYLEIGANKIRTRSHYRAHQMAIWLRLVPELQRSGAQMASTFHNRMRGGNDPILYAGRLKQPEEDVEETPELTGGNPLNSAQLYDLLLGYGYGLFGYGGEGQSPPELVETSPYDEGNPPSPGGEERSNNDKSPTLTMTTCYSPVSSSVQESSIKSPGSGSGSVSGKTFTGSTSLNETSSSFRFFDSKNFPPYSIILAITIAVGCSLLILNVSVFAVVYFQRVRKRNRVAKMTNTLSLQSENGDSELNPSNKYGEPPEILKSNRTTASSFLHPSNSHSQGQLEAELEALELTVKQHQQELLGEKALLGIESLTGNSVDLSGGAGSICEGASSSASYTSSGGVHDPVRQSGFPKQQQQLSHSYSSHNLPRDRYHRVQQSLGDSIEGQCGGGIVLLPQQQLQHGHAISNGTSDITIMGAVESGMMTKITYAEDGSRTVQQQQQTIGGQMLAASTLPRCNGNIGGIRGGGTNAGEMYSFVSPTTTGKPPPPPRGGGTGTGGFSTLPGQHHQYGSLKRFKQGAATVGDNNSDSNQDNDELKV